MTGAPRSPVEPCRHAPRCKRRVFKAQDVRDRGVPISLVLDTVPLPWPEGGRVILLDSSFLPAGEQLAKKLTATQVHKAFGQTTYTEHSEVCGAEQRKRKASKKTGHA